MSLFHNDYHQKVLSCMAQDCTNKLRKPCKWDPSLALIQTRKVPNSNLDMVFLFGKYFQKTEACIGDE